MSSNPSVILLQKRIGSLKGRYIGSADLLQTANMTDGSLD